MTPAQRALRRRDLQLAADLLRREVDASLTSLQPAVEPVLHGLAIGRFVLRHRRGLRRAGIVWGLWKLVRR
jgi:hypothetical protein